MNDGSMYNRRKSPFFLKVSLCFSFELFFLSIRFARYPRFNECWCCFYCILCTLKERHDFEGEKRLKKMDISVDVIYISFYAIVFLLVDSILIFFFDDDIRMSDKGDERIRFSGQNTRNSSLSTSTNRWVIFFRAKQSNDYIITIIKNDI